MKSLSEELSAAVQWQCKLLKFKEIKNNPERTYEVKTRIATLKAVQAAIEKEDWSALDTLAGNYTIENDPNHKGYVPRY